MAGWRHRGEPGADGSGRDRPELPGGRRRASAFNADVKAAAAEHGLWYPPDLSSCEICSIGGNVATNGGGLCWVKYGVTTDYVLGLDVVLADGTLVRLVPAQAARSTLVATFPSPEVAAEAVVAIRSALRPSIAGADGPCLVPCRQGTPADGARRRRR